MRHGSLGRRFNRDSAHRQAMFSNMIASLIKHEQIVTTLPKAKDLRRVMDKYITLAKRGDLNSRRLAASRMGDEAMTKKLFDVLAPRYKDRNGGYTRVLKAGYRYGDSAPRGVIELVDRDVAVKGAEDIARHEAELKARGESESKSPPWEPVLEKQSFGPPVAVRPPFDADGDEAGDLIKKLRVRAATASRQERRVMNREEAMKLIVDDLRMEQVNSAKLRKKLLDETNQTLRSVDDARRATESERVSIYEEQSEARRLADEQIQDLRREKDEAIRTAEEAMKAVREEQEVLKKQLDAIRKPAVVPDRSGSPEETTNLKRMVGVVDSMPPEDTARILQELVEKGRIEAVVAVLNAMKSRQSAKVLSAITASKPTLAADLVDRLKRIKKDGELPAESAK